jgi:hypothetical protein
MGGQQKMLSGRRFWPESGIWSFNCNVGHCRSVYLILINSLYTLVGRYLLLRFVVHESCCTTFPLVIQPAWLNSA